MKTDIKHMERLRYKATAPRSQEFMEVVACLYMLQELEQEHGKKLTIKHKYNGGQFSYTFNFGNTAKPTTYYADGAVFLADKIVWLGNICFTLNVFKF